MNPHPAALCEALGICGATLRARGLHPHEEAASLELAETGDDGRQHLLTPEATTAWRTLKAAAGRDGVALFIVSAFRSIERQAGIVRRKLDAGERIEDILAVCAPPGFSEHHTGHAIDIGTPGSPPLEVDFETTPAFAWLARHAAGFEFHLSYPAGNAWGYQYEPWHWCFGPVEADFPERE